MGLLAWQLRSVFLLVFGALILATTLRAASLRVERYSGLPPRWAFVSTILALVVVVVLGSWFIGDRLVAQFDQLRERLPEAIEAARVWLSDSPVGGPLENVWTNVKEGSVSWERVSGAAGLTMGALGNAALMGLMALYFAADPQRYRTGFVRLFPVEYRQRVGEALEAASKGLGSWLMGQGISMIFVGTATAVGLALLGVPLALSLGVIAGVFAFIPFFGPIASGVVAVAFAFVEGPRTALYVAGLCLAIQQVEGDVLMPFVQKWAVSLPPVLAVVAVVVFGLLFGVMGIVLATPLMVVLMILVRRLYVEGVLESGLDRGCARQ